MVARVKQPTQSGAGCSWAAALGGGWGKLERPENSGYSAAGADALILHFTGGVDESREEGSGRGGGMLYHGVTERTLYRARIGLDYP